MIYVGWKKIKDREDKNTWVNINKFVIVQDLRTVFTVYIGEQNDYKTKIFKTKSQAMRYAKKWMKAHPNG